MAEMERDEDDYDGGGERRAREGGELCARARYKRDAARASRAEGESIGWDGERAEADGGGELHALEGSQLCARAEQRDAACAALARGKSSSRDAKRELKQKLKLRQRRATRP